MHFAHVLGHSFCISRVAELLLAGVPSEIVAAISSWMSLAFLLYWHCMEDILPMCTSKPYKKQAGRNFSRIPYQPQNSDNADYNFLSF